MFPLTLIPDQQSKASFYNHKMSYLFSRKIHGRWETRFIWLPSDPRSYPVDPARASARPGQVGDVLSVRLLWFAVISRCSVALSSFLALQSTRLRILVLLNILNSHILSEISDYRSSDIRDKSGSAPRLTKLPFMIDNLVDNAPFRAVERHHCSCHQFQHAFVSLVLGHITQSRNALQLLHQYNGFCSHNRDCTNMCTTSDDLGRLSGISNIAVTF